MEDSECFVSDPKEVPDEEKTIFDWSKECNLERVKEYLEKGGDPNVKSPSGGSWSLLHSACIHNSVPMAQLLLEYQADVSVIDDDQNTPLHYAANFGSVNCCRIFLDHGAELEAKNSDSIFYISRIPIYSGGGRTPLMTAVLRQEAKVVEYLLSRGADGRKIQDNDGRSAYDLACRHSKLLMAPLLAPEKEMHVYVKEHIDIPQKIQKRVTLLQTERFEEYKKKIKEHYTPKHMDVYTFREEFFQESFLNAIKTGTKESLLSILTEVSPGIFQFDMLQHSFCDKLVEELENFERVCVGELKMSVRRPNSMNNYGVILDDIGFYGAIHDMMQKYISLFSCLLFKNHFGDSLDLHHCFLVRYKQGEDLDLALHVDDSEVTLNVCLGKEFTGGTLNFYGLKNIPQEKTQKYELEHKKGVGILHAGAHWHEANKIESGERCNLILWCRSSKSKHHQTSRKH